jgi:hypothetical protein
MALFQAVLIIVSFFGQGCIALTYADNSIIVGDSMQQIDALIKSIHG